MNAARCCLLLLAAAASFAEEPAKVVLVLRCELAESDLDEAAALRDAALEFLRDERLAGLGATVEPVADDGVRVVVDAALAEEARRLATAPVEMAFRITVEPGADSHGPYWEKFVRERAEGVDLEQARTVEPEERLERDRTAGRYPHGLRWYPLSRRAQVPETYAASRLPANEEGEPEPWVLVRLDAENVVGEDLDDVAARPDSDLLGGGGWVVSFAVKRDARERMGRLTAVQGEHMAILLDGRVLSAPSLQSPLTSSGQVSGRFTEEDARFLAAMLGEGPRRPLVLVSEEKLG